MRLQMEINIIGIDSWKATTQQWWLAWGWKKGWFVFFFLSYSFSFSFWFLFVFVNLISYLHLAQFPNHANFERLLPRCYYYFSLETPYSVTCVASITSWKRYKMSIIQVRRFKWFPQNFLTCDRRQDIRIKKTTNECTQCRKSERKRDVGRYWMHLNRFKIVASSTVILCRCYYCCCYRSSSSFIIIHQNILLCYVCTQFQHLPLSHHHATLILTGKWIS